MGIASDARELDPPLKGDNGNGNSSAGNARGAQGTVPTGDLSKVRWHVTRLGRRVDANRRLVILRGYARAAADGHLHAVQIRAMVDSGAQAEIISPDLARRLGGTVAEGRFGVAVEAFGRETALTQQARGIELRLPGTNPRSLLSQDFLTRWDFIVAPQGLSSEYDILLGTRFLRHFRLNLIFHEPCVIRLTASDGGETQLTEDVDFSDDDEECIQQERQSGTQQHARAAAVSTSGGFDQRRSPRPMTHSQRRAWLRE